MDRSMINANKDVAKEKLELVSIELNNFKSFEGQQIVGPFLRFTSVVGPNGGGKKIIFSHIFFR